jgi:putative flavoprotein involved in K+ transport
MNRLPGWSYQGADPDGFMAAAEVVAFLEQYATASSAPVVCGVTVRSVRRLPGGYRVESDRGAWHARCVVIATGHCDVPFVPAIAERLPSRIHQVTSTKYRNPTELPDGGVLVVGASASGVQLAEEIQRSGRQVTISVSRHTRLPRLYRGRDIMWWLDRYGILEDDTVTASELEAARWQPSMQLVGRPERTNLDLCVLRDIGVRLVGRTAGIDDGVLQLNQNLAEAVAGSPAGWSVCSSASTYSPTQPGRRRGVACSLRGGRVAGDARSCRPTASGPSFGPLASCATIAGCTCRCSMPPTRSSTPVGSLRHLVCM